MATVEVKNKNVTQKEFHNLTRSYQLDFEAVFDLASQEFEEIMRKAEKEGWTDDDILSALDEVFI